MSLLRNPLEERDSLSLSLYNFISRSVHRCESAHNIAMCMLKDMKEASYKIPEIKE